MLALIAMATTARAQVVLNETNFPDANFRAALASILGISEGDEITEAKIAATTTIDVSSKSIADLKGIEHFTALETLSCGNNQLTSLNVSNNTALTGLSCGGNQLTSLDVSKNTALTWLSCGYSQLTSLDVSKNTALTSLGCIGNQLTSLDVSKNAALTSLTCYFNQLTSLDVSRCTALKDLECSYNQLTSLDVSKNTALTGLGCSGNRLTSLDVSQNTALTWLNCNDNQLTSLDVSSKNTALERLNCRANKIKSKEMDALVESLPMVESGKFYVINTKYKNEGNVCTKSQVGIAKGKGWTVYDYNGGNSQEYEGSEDAVESSCPDDNHPHMIDLGLPSGTKWACCNLGAAKPEDYGGYYAWGETEEKDYYDWSTYDHCDGTERTSHDIGNDIAGTQYDAATANWGSPWMMPNIDQIKELLDNCESERTTENGVKGYRYTGPNGVSVFFPAGSLRHAEVDRNYLGTDGVYWSSSLTQWDTDKAYELIFTGNDTYYIYIERSSGLSVRPVVAKNENSEVPYVVWCGDNNTLYFLSSSSELKVGGTYKGYTISSLWSGEAVTNSPENKGTGFSPIAWMGFKTEKVVIEESFKDVLVNSTSAWFMGVESIEGLENLNTSNVTSMSFMFGSSKLTNLDLSHFDTRNVKYMQNMFLRCPNLASVNLSHFDTQNVLNMHWMFGECTSLSNLDLSSFNTENVTDMGSMFSLCSNLTSLDVSGFNTENVTDMGGMFGWCSNLTNLDVSKFKTENVTDMSSMFLGCSSLTSLDVSGFNTEKVTNMHWMFSGCSSLTSLDVSGFNTENVTDMGSMFSRCSNLTNLDVSKFKTENVTDMSRMFSGCSSLTSLDVSGFNTENVTDLSLMFEGCTNLETLYASNSWSMSNVDVSYGMFNSCEKLVGGSGTVYNPKRIDGQYARIDGGYSNPGYFTDKNAYPSGILLNAANFPDANFRAALAKILGISEGDEITEEKIAATTTLNVSKSYKTPDEAKIADLTGIEHFTALGYLSCFNNQLTSLDVSKNTALKYLLCYDNQLTSLDVSKNTKLTWLYCYGNQLTALDVSNNTALKELLCSSNQLTSLDVSKNTAQTYLNCSDNQLTSIDVSKNTALKLLYCSGNQLTALDVSKNTALEWLECQRNQLTALDVSKNTALTQLWCYSNQIKGESMDALVGSLPTVENGEFYVINTKDTNEGNVCTKSQVAIAKGKGWMVYDYNGGNRPYPEYEGSDPVAEGLLLNAENFPDANFRAALASILKISEGDEITEEKITATTELDISSKQIADLTGIEHFTALKELYCWNNQLTALDVSKNTALTDLICYNNQLTSLDVSKNTALTYLNCDNNLLTALDVSNNTALTGLLCENNQLTALDVSINTALTYLYCDNNQLTALDVSQNTALKELWCNKNQLTALDVSKNTALTELRCFSNQIKGEAMDALVASLPTVESGKFYVINTKDANEGNVCTKAQVAVAKGKGWTVYDYNYDGRNWIGSVEYEGSEDPVEDIDPVDEDDNIDFGSDMDENDDLNGNVIGDIYYNINTGDGGYDAAEGCIVVKKPTDDGTVNDLEGKDIFGEDFKSQFTGIVFKVPAGKGTIKVNAETTGNMLLKVKIGNNDPVEMELNGKLKVTFPYNVSETTYVYIYAGAANEAKGFGAPTSGDAALKIYGIEFIRDNTPTDINSVDSGELTVDSWYTIDGKKLAGEPKEKGIYIRNGKKVVK